MRRREFLGGGLAAIASSGFPVGAASAASRTRPRPGDPNWPSDKDWAEFGKAVGGRLSKPVPPAEAETFARNPFFRGDTPAIAQNVGWLDAWRAEPSAWVVAAESAEDVAAAVRFAAQRNLRLVARGGGHSYFGTSSAPDALMIWTRKMNAIETHDSFQPRDVSSPGVPAISLGAGCVWLHAYQAASSAKRYVQGGGCTTVGVGGFLLGGGFGSFSKRYGLAAASLLEAEIVTADGEIRVVNAARDPDLFWALKGGGAAFGIVTRFTLAMHDLPSHFGALNFTVKAKSDDAFRELIGKFLAFYKTSLFNPNWGETARFTPDNILRVTMVFQDLSGAEASEAFKPFADFVAADPARYEVRKPLSAAAIWASWLWSATIYRTVARDVVEFDGRPGANWGDFWWKGDGRQAGAFWDAYHSAWLPETLLEAPQMPALRDALFDASRAWSASLHFNKGLAGAPGDAVAAAQACAIHPDAASAFALAIIASDVADAPAPGSAQMDASRDRARRVDAAMAALRKAAPSTGCYLNECDYFLKNWADKQWGENYARLAGIKRKYDPDGLFFVRHGVGSEDWSDDGFTKT